MTHFSNMKLVLVLSLVTVFFVSTNVAQKSGNTTAPAISGESVETPDPKKDKGRSMKEGNSGNGTGRKRKPSRMDSKSRRYFEDHCRDRTYNIREIRDLTKHKNDLKCIFRNGVAPSKVPEGTWHGHVLTIMKMDQFNPFVSFFWNGNLCMKTTCNGKEAYIGFNNIVGMPAFPFTAKIGPLDETLAKGQYEDDKDNVIIDYTRDLTRVCPEFKSHSKRGNVMHNAFQMNQIINIMRLVGEKSDGSAIYLGKSYMRDGNNGDKKVNNIGYFAVTNFDPDITPPPRIESSREYSRRRYSDEDRSDRGSRRYRDD